MPLHMVWSKRSQPGHMDRVPKKLDLMGRAWKYFQHWNQVIDTIDQGPHYLTSYQDGHCDSGEQVYGAWKHFLPVKPELLDQCSSNHWNTCLVIVRKQWFRKIGTRYNAHIVARLYACLCWFVSNSLQCTMWASSKGSFSFISSIWMNYASKRFTNSGVVSHTSRTFMERDKCT